MCLNGNGCVLLYVQMQGQMAGMSLGGAGQQGMGGMGWGAAQSSGGQTLSTNLWQ